MFFGQKLTPNSPFNLSLSTRIGEILNLSNVALDPSSLAAELYIKQGNKMVLVTQLNRQNGVKSASINVFLSVQEHTSIVVVKGIVHLIGFYQSGGGNLGLGRKDHSSGIPVTKLVQQCARSQVSEQSELSEQKIRERIEQPLIQLPQQLQTTIARNRPVRNIKPTKNKTSNDKDIATFSSLFKGIDLKDDNDDQDDQDINFVEGDQDQDSDQDSDQDDDQQGQDQEQDQNQGQEKVDIEKQGSLDEKVQKQRTDVRKLTEQRVDDDNESTKQLQGKNEGEPRKVVKIQRETEDASGGSTPSPTKCGEQFKIPNRKPTFKK